MKIAFVGVTTPKTITSSTPKYFQDDEGNFIYGFMQDETGEKLYAAVQSAVDAAIAEGADYVIAMAHLGNEAILRALHLCRCDCQHHRASTPSWTATAMIPIRWSCRTRTARTCRARAAAPSWAASVTPASPPPMAPSRPACTPGPTMCPCPRCWESRTILPPPWPKPPRPSTRSWARSWPNPTWS